MRGVEKEGASHLKKECPHGSKIYINTPRLLLNPTLTAPLTT